MNLPTNIYINKDINNTNQKIYYSKQDKETNAKNKIESIFNSTNIVYDKNVIITTKEGSFNKNIIEKNNSCLITNINEIIPFETIINIKEICR